MMKPSPPPPDLCLSVPGEEKKGVRELQPPPQAKIVLGVSPATSEAFSSNVPHFSLDGLGRGYISERQTAAEEEEDQTRS